MKIISLEERRKRPNLRQDISIMDILVEIDDLHEKVAENRNLLDRILRLLKSIPR